jgi:DNA polymerase-3 subunit gamma/tau
VATQAVGEMLGAMDQAFLLRLIEAVAAANAAAAVAVADEMQARSLSYDSGLADLAALLLRVAMAQSIAGEAAADDADQARIADLAKRLDPESVQLYYQIALQGRQDLPLAPDEHAGFVMTILRMMAFRPDSPGAARSPGNPGVTVVRTTSPGTSAGWPDLVQQLPVAGAARELARNAELRKREGNSFDLVVPKAKAYLAERGYQEKLKAALDQHLGASVTVKVSVGEVAGATAAAAEAGERDARLAAATKSVRSDGFVNDVVSLLDGKVVDSTIRPDGK